MSQLGFDDFVLDVDTGELRKNGRTQKLHPQPAQLLELLVRRDGEIVRRQDIQEALWSDDTYVDYDTGINSCIRQIRTALGDDAEQPRYIETVPRRGYRFIGTRRSVAGETKRWSPRWPVGLAVSLCVGSLAVAAWLYFSRPVLPPPSRPVPLTALPGVERSPALSPDGNQVAFAWKVAGGKPPHLYIKQIGGDEPLQLTSDQAGDSHPAWSPDGSRIAFLRGTDSGSDVYIVPSLGGTERRIGSTLTARNIGAHALGLDWSPDGRFLAIVDRETPEDSPAIFLMSTETGEKRRLTTPPTVVSSFDKQPAFSPDGKTLAFVRTRKPKIMLLSLEDENAEERLLVAPKEPVGDVAWTADGSSLLFVSGLTEASDAIYRVSVKGGSPEILSFGNGAGLISVSREGNRLVFEKGTDGNSEIWRLRGPNGPTTHTPQKLIASTVMDYGAKFSPDGSKIAFTSFRSGVQHIWICNSEGEQCGQLTREAAALFPRWSPDGKSIAYRGFITEGSGDAPNPDIFVANVESGFNRRLTEDPSVEREPGWSRDGKWIYFSSDRTGEHNLWKVPSDGGDPIQLTHDGGIDPYESEDGKWIYYLNQPHKPDVRRIPVSGGEPELVLAGEVRSFAFWTLWGNHIVYRHRDGRDVRSFHLDTREIETVTKLELEGISMYYGLTVSPDGLWVLMSFPVPPTGDLFLVENFQ